MSLLDDILNAATDEKVAVSALLNKCRLLARRLGHEKFTQWVLWESDGYSNDAPVPDYRKVPASLKMVLSTLGRTYTGLPVPISAIPSQLTSLREINIRNGISSLEEMSAVDNKTGALRVPLGWMAHDFQRLNDQCAETKLEGEILDLWHVMSTGQIASICNTVRGRVLDFTVEIQKKPPNAGEMSGDSPAAADRKRGVNQVFHTTVNKGGSVNMMGTVIDSTVINITVKDFDGLSKFLADNGLSPENIGGLKEALEVDNGGLGSNVQKWLGKMTEMAAKGALKISVDSVMDAVKQYCGLG